MTGPLITFIKKTDSESLKFTMPAERHAGLDNTDEGKNPEGTPFLHRHYYSKPKTSFDHIWGSCSVSGRLRVGGGANQNAAALLFRIRLKPVLFPLD